MILPVPIGEFKFGYSREGWFFSQTPLDFDTFIIRFSPSEESFFSNTPLEKEDSKIA